MKPKPSSSSSAWGDEHHSCCNKVTEFICSACLLCVCCPLASLCYCIKAPCKIGWRMARHARRRAPCCGSEKRVFAAYSSFSDMELDTPKQEKDSSRSSKTQKDK